MIFRGGGDYLEYRKLNSEIYKKYLQNALTLISKIAEYFSIAEEDITYKETIRYFESNYNIYFHYLAYDYALDFWADTDITEIEASQADVKFPDIVSSATIEYVDCVFLSKCSGLTIPFDDKYFVSINQHNVPKSRVIFTILHELSHIYCHLENKDKKRVYVSLAGDHLSKYPKEIIPFEDEANTVASLLFLNDKRLEKYLKNEMQFKEILKESGMSESALHNRIKNYFMYNLDFLECELLGMLLNYREGDDELLKVFNLKMMSKSLREFLKEAESICG